MPDRGEIAVFPLHTVLFPGGRLPLRLFEQRYLGMAKACLRDDAPFGVCLIREGAEVGTPATPQDVGCLARIVHWDMPQPGLLEIVAQCGQRFRIVASRVQGDGLVVGGVELLPEVPDAPVPDRLAACRQFLERIVADHGEQVFAAPMRYESSAWLSARLAEILPLPLATKQQLLEMDDALRRLELLYGYLTQQA